MRVVERKATMAEPMKTKQRSLESYFTALADLKDRPYATELPSYMSYLYYCSTKSYAKLMDFMPSPYQRLFLALS